MLLRRSHHAQGTSMTSTDDLIRSLASTAGTRRSGLPSRPRDICGKPSIRNANTDDQSAAPGQSVHSSSRSRPMGSFSGDFIRAAIVDEKVWLFRPFGHCCVPTRGHPTTNLVFFHGSHSVTSSAKRCVALSNSREEDATEHGHQLVTNGFEQKRFP